MGNEAKWEYLRVMYERYHKAERKARAVLLDEFCVTTRYNRKYAIRLLNGARPEQERVRRAGERKPRQGKQVISVLAAVWEAAGSHWSVRLKALVPSWMPWIRKRYRLSAKLEQELLAMSARQMDRRLQSRKRQQKRKIYGRTKPGVLLKHHIPIRTDSWDVKAPVWARNCGGCIARQTPWKRVLASGQADARRVAELKKLRSMLDPFALAQSIDRKLESIYKLANRRLSPKTANLRGAKTARSHP